MTRCKKKPLHLDTRAECGKTESPAVVRQFPLRLKPFILEGKLVKRQDVKGERKQQGALGRKLVKTQGVKRQKTNRMF